MMPGMVVDRACVRLYFFLSTSAPRLQGFKLPDSTDRGRVNTLACITKREVHNRVRSRGGYTSQTFKSETEREVCRNAGGRKLTRR